ncbi:MAG: 23S rRNA (adenine(2503)-C(2))-methyltransferase RlmN [Clostridia bacterium]|nr:23S rRNA (adenine(2503)-C(2))-methyltransferase RlmN [Clostridia bacterium]
MIPETKKDIRSMLPEEISEELISAGFPAFRAKQVFGWLSKGVTSFDQMTNIPKDLREYLLQKYYIFGADIENRQISEYDSTVKYLFRLFDGRFVESVLMKYKYGYSICISTQVGCRMNCAFCATGKGGFERNLYPSEMLAQIMTAQADRNIRISHVVLMGMGEPLDNYDNVLRFLKLAALEQGLNLSMRHISLSTCGLVGRMEQLMQEKLQLTLSVSLHAPTDEIRDKIMPVNKSYNVDTLLECCKKYTQATSRRISFEYIMINGVNDSPQCAEILASKLKGMLCHVNLIPANEVKESGFVKSNRDTTVKFADILSGKGINVTIRRTLGSDIDASCGQLRSRAKSEGGK